jgi:hypothetical protein
MYIFHLCCYKFFAFCFVQFIQLELNISCENMNGYQCSSYLYISNIVSLSYIYESSPNLNDIAVLCCYVSCVVICTGW